MPEFNMSDNHKIEISLRTVLEIMHDAQDFFRRGSGLDIDNNENELESPGVIDELNPDTPAFAYVNDFLFFLRFVNGILSNAINEDNNQDGEI